MRQGLALPLSIFAGAIVIAIGLFLGLRTRGPQGANTTEKTNATGGASGDSVTIDPTHAPASSSTMDGGVALEKNVPPPPVPFGAMPGGPDDKSSALVAAELEKQKKTFLATCWKPAVAKAPKPATVTYAFTMSFDGQGLERARGISPVALGEEGRPDVADCLRSIPTMFKVAPPANGQPFTVNAKVTLP